MEAYKVVKLTWRDSRSIAALKAKLQAAIHRTPDGTRVAIEFGTAQSLLEICDQAIHTERGHEQPQE